MKYEILMGYEISVLAIWTDFFPGMFGIHIDKWFLLEISFSVFSKESGNVY